MNDQSKILIIDDEEIVRDSCTAILSGSDYQVQTAKNGIKIMRGTLMNHHLFMTLKIEFSIFFAMTILR